MKAAKITTENPELADRFNRVLESTVNALEEAGIKYVFIGGIASGGLGRPRSTHDIDVFVQQDDAELALRALAKHGFRTEKTDPVWLYKGFKEDVLVDIIFKSKGEIYLDTELYQRSITAEFHGKRLRLVAPEDLIVIKALAHSELCPGHWHDALALLSHAQLDWDYLLKRSRRAPRRVLSLLLYAHSNDIWVPKRMLDQLFITIFGESANHHAAPTVATAPQTSPPPPPSPPRPISTPVPPSNAYIPAATVVPLHSHHGAKAAHNVGHLRERLAEDPRLNELDIQIEHAGDAILLRGEVLTNERREAVGCIAVEMFPDMKVENQVRVVTVGEPSGEELG